MNRNFLLLGLVLTNFYSLSLLQAKPKKEQQSVIIDDDEEKNKKKNSAESLIEQEKSWKEALSRIEKFNRFCSFDNLSSLLIFNMKDTLKDSLNYLLYENCGKYIKGMHQFISKGLDPRSLKRAFIFLYYFGDNEKIENFREAFAQETSLDPDLFFDDEDLSPFIKDMQHKRTKDLINILSLFLKNVVLNKEELIEPSSFSLYQNLKAEIEEEHLINKEEEELNIKKNEEKNLLNNINAFSENSLLSYVSQKGEDFEKNFFSLNNINRVIKNWDEIKRKNFLTLALKDPHIHKNNKKNIAVFLISTFPSQEGIQNILSILRHIALDWGEEDIEHFT